MAAGLVSMRHRLLGPNQAMATACTTGAHSIGDASRFIALGDADVMLAGASEACIHPLTFAGFGKARSLSTRYNDDAAASCRPFDAGRDGLVVAEGAALCLLEELDHARARGARIYAELRGYGCSADAYHMTSPCPDGDGAHRAMQMALAKAGIRPADVDYINAHATGTQAGDLAEATAIQRLMLGPDGKASPAQVTVSSTKGASGHLMGAAGALEALVAVMSIHEVRLCPRRRLFSLSPSLPFSPSPSSPQISPLTRTPSSLPPPPTGRRAADAQPGQARRRGRLQLCPARGTAAARRRGHEQQLWLRRRQQQPRFFQAGLDISPLSRARDSLPARIVAGATAFPAPRRHSRCSSSGSSSASPFRPASCSFCARSPLASVPCSCPSPA